MGEARLRVGLVGLGNNMLSHVGRLVRMPEVEVVGACDPVAAMHDRARDRYADLAAMPGFATHEELLRQVAPDAVVISTPHAFHCRQVVDALHAGAHALVEKPMVNSVREANEVIGARDAAGKVVMVSYQRHTQAPYLKIKELIDAGRIGTVEMIVALQNQSWYAGQMRRARTGDVPWRMQAHLSGGGQLNDSGSHLVDILLHVTGLEPAQVYAAQQAFDAGVDVNSAVTVRFTSGAQASLAIVGNAPCIASAVWEDVTIYGSEGAIYYRMMGQPGFEPRVELRRIGENDPVDMGPLPEGTTPDQHFVDVIRGRSANLVPAECGLRVMQLSEAAWLSAATGAVVEVASLGHDATVAELDAVHVSR